MATLKTNLLEPSTGTTLTVGESGGDFVIGADSIKNNVLKDAGGNAIFTSNGSGVLSGLNAGFGSAQVLIDTTNVSSAVANVAFTSGIDSTYKEYVIEFINIVPATDNVDLKFLFGTGGTPTYGVLKTSTNFYAIHNQDDSYHDLGYSTSGDLADSTASQQITWGNTPNNDGSMSGEMHLFNPASTTYIKNWYIRTNQKSTNPRSQDQFVAGDANTTTALTAIKFEFSSGNISDGTFKLYGIK